jgi:cytochrome c oxidase subunit 3
MEVTMTTDEHNQERKIIQIDIVVLHGQYDYDVCRSYQCICGSKSRVDWLTDFELPTAFYYSTIVIMVVVSHFIWLKSIQKDNKSATTFLFCYFSIGDIVCDPAVYGLWSDSAR